MSEIKAIETEYNGYRFRSRLEARWAVFFDNMGIKYLYEPQGFVMSDGTCYLPDFFLPNMNQFFEVKGVFKLTDQKKVKQFVHECKMPVIVGFEDFTFEACDCFEEWVQELKSGSVLMKCNKCGNYYFIGVMGSWKCTCCGHYDGDNTSEWISNGELNTENVLSSKAEKDKFLNAIKHAKQARFEYGECG